MAKERPRRSRTGAFYTPRRTQQAEDQIAWLARSTRWNFGQVPICLVTHFYCEHRRFDLDNAHKLVADALQKGGLFQNDKQIVAGAYLWTYSVDPHTLIGVCEWNDEASDLLKLL